MLSYRNANIDDLMLYFEWANEYNVRQQSFDSGIIDLKTHKRWFEKKINDEDCMMLIFQENEKNKIGQVRIQKVNVNEALIGISIANEHRGKGYAKEILSLGSKYFLEQNPEFIINAYVKETNLSSKYAFEKAGFIFKGLKLYQNFISYHYTQELCK
jgi:RimJ/RimL family protein N-acetyltransferase